MADKIESGQKTAGHKKGNIVGSSPRKKLGATIAQGTVWIVVGSVMIYLIAGFFCNQYIWRGTEAIYPYLQIGKYFAPFFVAYIYLMWLVYVLYREYRRSQENNQTTYVYLEEILAATHNIYNDSKESIELSPELENAQMQLNNIKLTVRERERQAKEAEQRKNDLVVYLAHDLKTPLTSVIGYLSLLHDEQAISPELQQKYEGIALDKALHLEDLINEFFEITRFNLTNLTLDVSEVNLLRMLEQTVFEFAPILSEKNITCNLQTEGNLTIKCDAAKLERVFENLLRNAYNYGYQDSEIRVEAEIVEKTVRICVTNHGNTIPSEKLDRIFEQFYRLDSSRASNSGGSGLGLAIAKEIVELHHGSIRAKSQDEIIQFEVILPTGR